jgi:hypothetical protein
MVIIENKKERGELSAGQVDDPLPVLVPVL